MLSKFFIIAHAVVYVFATGRSDTKTVFFFIYLAGILLLWYFFRKKHIAPHISKAILIWTFIGAVAAYVWNMIEYVLFMRINEIPFMEETLIHGKGFFTVMQLFHNHVTKAAVGVITEHVSPGSMGHLDDARSLLGLFPDWMYGISSLLCLIAIVGMILSAVVVIPKLRAHTPSRRWAYGMLFILTTFMILKSIVDGGILDISAIAAMPFFIVLMFGESKVSKVVAGIIPCLYLVFLACVYCLNDTLFSLDSGYTYQVFCVITALDILLVFYAFSSVKSHAEKRLAVLMLCFTAILFLFQFYNHIFPLPYVFTPISKTDGAIVTSYNQIADEDFTLIGSVGEIFIYKFIPENNGVVVEDIVAKTGINENTRPVSVPWKSCIPSSPLQRYQFSLMTPEPLQSLTATSSFYSMTAVPVISRGPGHHFSSYAYNVTISMPECISLQPIDIFEEIISQQQDRFVILNINLISNVVSNPL